MSGNRCGIRLVLLAVIVAAGCGGGGGRGSPPGQAARPAASEGSSGATATQPSEPAQPPTSSQPQQPNAEATSPEPGNVRQVVVLFPSASDELLHGQKRNIFWTSTLETRAKQVLSELASGPTEGLLPVLPRGVHVREFFLMPDGTAFVDFSREILGLAGGSFNEKLAVAAIVDSVALNFPEVRRVQILVEGEEVETLSGHLDMRYPFRPDPSVLEPALAATLQGGLVAMIHGARGLQTVAE